MCLCVLDVFIAFATVAVVVVGACVGAGAGAGADAGGSAAAAPAQCGTAGALCLFRCLVLCVHYFSLLLDSIRIV